MQACASAHLSVYALKSGLNLHVRRERTSQAIPDASHTHLCIVNQFVTNTCQISVRLTIERKDCDMTGQHQINQMRSSRKVPTSEDDAICVVYFHERRILGIVQSEVMSDLYDMCDDTVVRDHDSLMNG